MSELAESNISVVNDVFIKQITFPRAGMTMMTHLHVYDHQTLVAAGRLCVIVDGEESYYQAPSIIVIEANKHHALVAMDDHTIAYCIHAVKGGETIDEAEPLVQGSANADLHHLF
jgi:quercetin dioxygenase-like cupin family protein